MQTIKTPPPFILRGSSRSTLWVMFLGGALCFLLGLKTEPARTWSAFLHNHFYFMSLAVGGLFFAALQWITGAMWSAPVRRLGESFSAYLPVALICMILLYFGSHHLYKWSLFNEFVKGDMILESKAGYLEIKFFMFRNIAGILLWIYFAKLMIGNSLAQDVDANPEYTLKNRKLAPAFIILFAVSFTITSFDQIMSLDPHWFSTMFGVYCFSGLFYSTLAGVCVLTLFLRSRGFLGDLINENHLHDLGKFMFAFTVFWAYIGFSQFMLIWYANLPEETGYFLRRFHGGWAAVSLFLLIGKFLVPFFILLPRDAKRNPQLLGSVGIFMLVAQWVDVYWMVQPEIAEQGPKLGWVEIGVAIGFFGVFCLMVAKFLTKNNLVAIGDPQLAKAVFHHHQ